MKKQMSKKTRKLVNRSGQRECPICRTPQVLVEHHINGKDIPDAEALSNKAYVCDNCHRKIHMGRIILEGWCQTTSGKELFWHEPGDDSFTGMEATPYISSDQ
jgi:hypothetical protein